MEHTKSLEIDITMMKTFKTRQAFEQSTKRLRSCDSDINLLQAALKDCTRELLEELRDNPTQTNWISAATISLFVHNHIVLNLDDNDDTSSQGHNVGLLPTA